MGEGKITNFYTHGPRDGQKPQYIIFMLHGVGANGQDLLGLAPEMGRALPHAVFISPDAPFAFDMAPIGYQWFSLSDRSPDRILSGIEHAMPVLEQFIEEQMEKYGVKAGQVALLGFSQGTMMSLYFAPRYSRKLAGVLGYSGALFGEEGLIQDPEEFQKLPIHLIHGEADEVVPVAAHAYATDVLKRAGYPVSGYTQPGLPHGIDPKGIESGAAFLKNVLA